MNEIGKALPWVAFWVMIAFLSWNKINLPIPDCSEGYNPIVYNYGEIRAECVKAE